ncbi:hypothetical protein BKA82DRAFT_4511868 [Pisolithus tinctorius]|nr:hypothetical protein BKA82DRAFT_4511868 [Pisolithus tinctorius]
MVILHWTPSLSHFRPSARVISDFETPLPSSTAQVTASAHVPISCTAVDHHPDTTPAETAHSNATSVPGVTTSSTHPNNGTPNVCNGGVSVVKAAGNKSTWATRNPGRPVMQPPQRRDRDTLLNDAIQSLANEFEMKVQAVATTHNVTSEKVKKLLGSQILSEPAARNWPMPLFTTRQTRLMKVARGEKLSLQQIRELARADPKYQDMTQDEKDELLRALTEYRTLKNVSVRLQILQRRAMHSRPWSMFLKYLMDLPFALEYTHASLPLVDTSMTHRSLSGTEPIMSMDFWEDVMDLKPDEIIRKLEQWACMHGKNIEERNSLLTCAYTQVLFAKKKIQINFVNFEVAIKERIWHRATWVAGECSVPVLLVPLQNAEHLRTLHDALKAGTTNCWGSGWEKPRKKRSDAGRKCRCTAPGKGKAPKSITLIDSSSEDNSSTEDDE